MENLKGCNWGQHQSVLNGLAKIQKGPNTPNGKTRKSFIFRRRAYNYSLFRKQAMSMKMKSTCASMQKSHLGAHTPQK